MRVLVVAAHPDDEVLGCGGYIRKLADGGTDIFLSVIGEGALSRDKCSGRDVELLKEAGEVSAEILGIKKVVYHNLPDQKFDTLPILDITKIIEREIETLKPDMILTHHFGDLNRDHRIVSESVMVATRPTADCQVKKVLTFETPSSTEWNFNDPNKFMPHIFIDVSEVIDYKIKALEAYESETRNYPHPRSPDAIVNLAKHWGIVSGLEMAEAFMLVREIIK